MTIEITRPEIEARIQQRLHSGDIHDIDELLIRALDALLEKEMAAARAAAVEPANSARDLVELFASSPFRGLNINFERDRDPGRDIKL